MKLWKQRKKKDQSQVLTREQIISAIKNGWHVVAWLSPNGAIVYDPDNDNNPLSVLPGAGVDDVVRMATETTSRHLLIQNGVRGPAFAEAYVTPGKVDDGGFADQGQHDTIWEAARKATARIPEVMTRKQVVSMITGNAAVAWVTGEGFIIYAPDDGFWVHPGAGYKDITSTPPCPLAIVDGVTGLAFAVALVLAEEDDGQDQMHCDLFWKSARLAKELIGQATREQIVSAIQYGKSEVSWMTEKGAIIYGPPNKISFHPGAGRENVSAIVAERKMPTVIKLQGVVGLAFAVSKDEEREFCCQAECPHPDPLACADQGCHDVLWGCWEGDGAAMDRTKSLIEARKMRKGTEERI